MTHDTFRPRVLGLGVLALLTGGGLALAQSAGETFVATASLKTAAAATATAPTQITITHWASDTERDQAVDALKSGGNTGLKSFLDKQSAAGSIQVGDQKTTVRFARAVPSSAGRVITVIASEPLAHLGAGLANAKPREGYDFTVVFFEVNSSGQGTAGDLAPAAKLTVKADKSFLVEDYGQEVVRLASIAKK
jgi:hypothetical protein